MIVERSARNDSGAYEASIIAHCRRHASVPRKTLVQQLLGEHLSDDEMGDRSDDENCDDDVEEKEDDDVDGADDEDEDEAEEEDEEEEENEMPVARHGYSTRSAKRKADQSAECGPCSHVKRAR